MAITHRDPPVGDLAMCDHCGCRAFPPIAELTAEHVEILAMAWELAETARTGHPATPGVLDSLLALLDLHVIKEEAGLYPELLEVGALAEDACAALEEEHRVVREALVAGRFDRSEFYELASHIEVEEMELFSAARFNFEEPEWEEMAGVHLAAAQVLSEGTP